MRKPIIQDFARIWVGWGGGGGEGGRGTLIGPPALCLSRVVRLRWVTGCQGAALSLSPGSEVCGGMFSSPLTSLE